MSGTHRADERRFLDERGSNVGLAPNGLNPATIMEKAVRERIVDSYFWKEQCFGVNEADIVNRCVEHVTFIGGTHGANQKPSPFLCLAFKLLQLSPSDDVLDEYLKFGGDKFKYLRALAVFYVRLTRKADVVYRTLEPFLEDRRKLRRKARMGTSLTFVDQFVDDLLVKERVCGTSLWQMPKRELLEDLDQLEPRVSPLGDIEELLEEEEEREREEAAAAAAVAAAAKAEANGKGHSDDDEALIDEDDDDDYDRRRGSSRSRSRRSYSTDSRRSYSSRGSGRRRSRRERERSDSRDGRYSSRSPSRSRSRSGGRDMDVDRD